jgi:hypothetical protein
VKESEEEPMSLNDRRFTNVLLVVIAVVLFVGLVLPTEAKVDWESSFYLRPNIRILKVRGGWLVAVSMDRSVGATFIPDPEHKNKPIPVD